MLIVRMKTKAIPVMAKNSGESHQRYSAPPTDLKKLRMMRLMFSPMVSDIEAQSAVSLLVNPPTLFLSWKVTSCPSKVLLTKRASAVMKHAMCRQCLRGHVPEELRSEFVDEFLVKGCKAHASERCTHGVRPSESHKHLHLVVECNGTRCVPPSGAENGRSSEVGHRKLARCSHEEKHHGRCKELPLRPQVLDDLTHEGYHATLVFL
mmetsp:Transcript_2302/g.5375  ORF Transcript_2302/g.5375 Transcript_2302/m.5375 type:complete len:207 (-) Transcript_2302:439-1059(-)